MATASVSAYAAATGAGGEAAAAAAAAGLSRARARARPPPPRLALLSRSPPARWVSSISLRRGLHLAAAAAEAREEEGPAWVELEPVGSEQQFDRVLAEAQKRGAPIVVLWTASWCRKCIYLKPKLEKLAAEYYPRIQFYCVDVNAVPQKFVNRAGVTKMPAIQMWSDSLKQAEVIGGHKSWLVINDVRSMIEQEE